MTSQKKKGYCSHCHQYFRYYLIHNERNDTAYSYCDTCGMLSLVGGHGDDRIPMQLEQRLLMHRVITRDLEEYLEACDCGGHFRSDSVPRCPHCQVVLSPVRCSDWIESGASANRSLKAKLFKRFRWRWQRNWTGLYSIVIEDRYVKNNWKASSITT